MTATTDTWSCREGASGSETANHEPMQKKPNSCNLKNSNWSFSQACGMRQLVPSWKSWYRSKAMKLPLDICKPQKGQHCICSKQQMSTVLMVLCNPAEGLGLQGCTVNYLRAVDIVRFIRVAQFASLRTIPLLYLTLFGRIKDFLVHLLQQ